MYDCVIHGDLYHCHVLLLSSVHVVRRLFTFDRMGVLDVFTGNQIINFTEAGMDNTQIIFLFHCAHN